MNFSYEEFDNANYEQLRQTYQHLKNKQAVFIDAMEEDGFAPSRFLGRMVGYYHAAMNDHRMPRMKTYDQGVILTPFTEQEEYFFNKTEEKLRGDIIFDQRAALGAWEGIFIFLYEQDHSLLYAETDIDLNKYCNETDVPSYAMKKSVIKVAAMLGQWNKSPEEACEELLKDGLSDKGAAHIVYEVVLPMFVSQKRKSALKNILVGALFLVGGILVTWWSYSSALESGGKYRLFWGAIVVGLIELVVGIVQYIKASMD